MERKREDEAEPLFRECLKFREQHAPDFWRTFETKSLLGGSLIGQKKFAEAEPLLLAGYEGIEQHEAKLEPIYRPRLTSTIERLVQFFELTGDSAQAEHRAGRLSATHSVKPAETKTN